MAESSPNQWPPEVPQPPLAPPKPVEPVDVVTVVETIYHQPFGEEPTAIDCRFERRLTTSDQLYHRRPKRGATEDWQRLDLGWVEKPGIIVIKNEEGRFTQVQPTEEERTAAAKKVIEVTHSDFISSESRHGVFLIYPGESMRMTSSRPDLLIIRSQSGEAKFSVYIVPA